MGGGQANFVPGQSLDRAPAAPQNDRSWDHDVPAWDRWTRRSRIVKTGVTAEYIVFHDEGHGFTKKANQIAGYNAVLRFLDQYLKRGGT